MLSQYCENPSVKVPSIDSTQPTQTWGASPEGRFCCRKKSPREASAIFEWVCIKGNLKKRKQWDNFTKPYWSLLHIHIWNSNQNILWGNVAEFYTVKLCTLCQQQKHKNTNTTNKKDNNNNNNEILDTSRLLKCPLSHKSICMCTKDWCLHKVPEMQ